MTKTRKSNVITPENLVSCLENYESFDTKSIAQRLPKRFHVKSCSELQFEKDKREGKVILQYA